MPTIGKRRSSCSPRGCWAAKVDDLSASADDYIAKLDVVLSFEQSDDAAPRASRALQRRATASRIRWIEYAIDSICDVIHIMTMDTAINVFATLADPIRLRCLALISGEGEVCVCELVGALDLPQPKISRHLGACPRYRGDDRSCRQ